MKYKQNSLSFGNNLPSLDNWGRVYIDYASALRIGMKAEWLNKKRIWPEYGIGNIEIEFETGIWYLKEMRGVSLQFENKPMVWVRNGMHKKG